MPNVFSADLNWNSFLVTKKNLQRRKILTLYEFYFELEWLEFHKSALLLKVTKPLLL